MIKKIFYFYLLPSFLLSFTTYAHQAQKKIDREEKLIEEIIDNDKVILFDTIFDQVIPKKFQASLKSRETRLLTKDYKRYILKLVQQEKGKKDIPSLQAILENNIDQKNIDAILQIQTAIVLGEDDSIERLHQQLVKESVRILEKFGMDIAKIQEEMKELYEAQQNLNELIIEQGKNIDIIEENIENAKEEVEEAVENIEKAEVYQNKNRKIYIILLALLLLIGLLVLLSLRKRFKSKK